MTEMLGLWPEVKCSQLLGMRTWATVEFFEWEAEFEMESFSSRLSPPLNTFFSLGLLWNSTLAITCFMVIRDSGVFQNTRFITVIGTALILNQVANIRSCVLTFWYGHSWILFNFLPYNSESRMGLRWFLIEFFFFKQW